jgi:putative tricarboxylic transport membrane protein
MKQKKIIFSIILFVFATAAIFYARQLPFGSLEEPQAGFWPLILTIMLAFFSLIHLVISMKEQAESGISFFAGEGDWEKIAMTVVAMFAFGLVFEYLGYMISVFLLTGFLLRVVEPIKWRLVITISLVSSVLTYFVLTRLLGFILPAGKLGL